MVWAMSEPIALQVNGQTVNLDVPPETPLLYVLRNDLGLKGPKVGCVQEQCGACKVLVDGQAVPSCNLPVGHVAGLPVVTVEGLGQGDTLHPLQEAFVEAQASQCGYCAAGMIIAAQGLLNRVRYPTDDEIRTALADNLCRCGIYDRVRRAIHLRTGRVDQWPGYEVLPAPGSPAMAKGPLALPRALEQAPAVDNWIRIDIEGTITLFTGKVEYGQGIQTAIAQIGAEELGVTLARVRVVMADTAQTPDEGMTVGSMSLETSGAAIRLAAATARHHLLSLAFEELEAAGPGSDALTVDDGTVTDPVSGRSTTYWQLLGGRRFGIDVTGTIAPQLPSEHTIVGSPAKRLDLRAKVNGQPAFVHDVSLPGTVHARVVRPPQPGARLQAVDTAGVTSMPGVLDVVRDGSFLAVVAEREEQAIEAAERLREQAVWVEAPLPLPHAAYEALYDQPATSFLIVDGTAVEGAVPAAPAPPDATQTVTATYERPYQMHASLGPSAAVALYEDGKLALWIHSQGVFPQRANIAHVLGMDPEDLHVSYRDGSGCYGHNGADDAALDAALVARALPGRPISLKWSRADEHGWEPYAPAMRIRLQASLDATGQIADWRHDVWSPSHFGRSRMDEGISGLLASWYREEPLAPPPSLPSLGTHSGSYRNADPLYTFPRRVVSHHLPHSPLRVSTMRSLGAFANVFAIESFMDELAHAAGADPIAFRLRHLADPRAIAVIRAAAEKAGWQPSQSGDGQGRGRGLAFAQYKNRQTYAAVVADVQVDGATGDIRLERAVIAADAAQIVNPDGLSNQLEGGFVQAASMALYEQVDWDEGGITSLDWESYPILRFPNAPVIETVLLNRPELPPVGAGEATQGPTPAAIANAIFAATGIRLRKMPFQAELLRAMASR
jgi:nicotinate dehydrogenase subunit B